MSAKKKNIITRDNYLDYINDSYENNNTMVSQANKKDDSLDKYFKPLEDKYEADDILKQLEKLNLSDEKSFDVPQKAFQPLVQKSVELSKKTNSNRKEKKDMNKINIEDIYTNLSIKDLKKEKYDLINEIKRDNIDNDINKMGQDEAFSNGEENEKLSEFLLKEKLNRICASIQGYTLNQKCYQNLNNFIPFLSQIPQNLYKPMDNLFDVYIELLMRIKQEFNVKENLILKLNNVSLNNEGYEKKLLKLKKELKEKEKEIGSLINKVNIEKEKIKDNSKSKLLEINTLKKENQQLNNKITLYKNQIRKTEADLKAVQSKLRYYIFEKENRNNSSSNLTDKNNSNKKENNNPDEFKINNEKYLAIKKLNMSLVYLLKDINKNICKYDFSLNKIINNDNQANNNYEIDDLSENIETNLLINENNCKNLCKNFLFNMDIINNKIIDILKQKNDITEKINIKALNNKKISNNNNIYKKEENNYRKDKSWDHVNKKQMDEIYNKNIIKDNYNSINNKINLLRKEQISNSLNYKNIPNNNIPGLNIKKVDKSINNNVNTKYEYNIQSNDKKYDNSSVNKKKKSSLNFLNFYNNDDKDLEENIETRAVLDPKWYENCKNKKVGYVFDKNKLFTCKDEEDRTNGAKRK